jgi:hypothetical protein
LKGGYSPAVVVGIDQARKDNVVGAANHLIDIGRAFKLLVRPDIHYDSIPLQDSSVGDCGSGIGIISGSANDVFAPDKR